MYSILIVLVLYHHQILYNLVEYDLVNIRGNRDLKMILNDNNIGLDIEDLNETYNDTTNEELLFLKIDIANRDN